MHLLIFLEEEDKIHTVEQVDHIISAQIPDLQIQPQLYKALKKLMLHGSCSSQRCLGDHGKCQKRFPKPFTEETYFKEDGYPDYKRSNNGHTIQKGSDVFDNRHVVPHNPRLLVEFQCHINVEISASIKATKYIHKYIYKGRDRATLEMTGVDEVKEYLDSRYISSVEAAWHIFEFPMHMKHPSVYRLPVHLPGEQMVVYDPGDDIQQVVEHAQAKDTCLTGWFKANSDEALITAGAHDILYQDFPKKFVWDKRGTKWTVRQRGKVIGRMFYIAPTVGERFYLRLLLTEVKGESSMWCLMMLKLNI